MKGCFDNLFLECYESNIIYLIFHLSALQKYNELSLTVSKFLFVSYNSSFKMAEKDGRSQLKDDAQRKQKKTNSLEENHNTAEIR